MGQALKKARERTGRGPATKQRSQSASTTDDWMLSGEVVATKHLKDAVESLGSGRITVALSKIATALRIYEAMPTRARLQLAHLHTMRKVVEACMKQAAEADSNSAHSAPELLGRIRAMEQVAIH